MIKPHYLLLALAGISSAHAATPISKYMGEWNQARKYQPGQVVSRDEKSWLCVAKCNANEPGSNPDAWVTLGSNVQGPKGDTGPQGLPGPIGPVGQQGPTGPQGLQGVPGSIGPQGEQGPKGAQGPQGVPGADGAQGPQGLKGDAGPQGLPGPMGLQGPKGDTGARGATGPQGLPGATGPQGPKGDTGARGPTGPQGPQGPAGSGGGVKVYDANNQLLGYALGGLDLDSYSGTYLRGQTILLQGSGKLAYFGFYLEGSPESSDIATELKEYVTPSPDNYFPKATYKSNDCSGSISVWRRSLSVTNVIGKYNGSYGYVTEAAVSKGSEMRSALFTEAQCTAGQVYQTPPEKVQVCKTLPATIGYYSMSSGNCSQYGLSDPCYPCGSNTYGPLGNEELAEYKFNPVTLPFNLPVALPLRYEVQQ